MTENIDDHLLKAKQELANGNTSRAISILSDAMEHPERKASAAYSLGIIYDSAGEFQNKKRAEEYYLIAEDLGSEIATYRIAGLQQRSGKPIEALERFRKIADRNPSAAYWSYRLIADTDPADPDAKLFREQASRQGHILAKRDILLDQVKGKYGILPIFTSLFGFANLFFKTKKAYANDDRMLYQ